MKPKSVLGKLAIMFGLALMMLKIPTGSASENTMVFRISDFFLSNHPAIEAFIPQHFRFSQEKFIKEPATENSFSQPAQNARQTPRASDALLNRLKHDASVRDRFNRSV